MAGYTHFLTMTTNPGAVPGSAVPLNVDEEFEIGHGKLNSLRSNMYCMKCNAYKPKRAHHCSVCNRCVVKMDHHCPWVNNCVGIGNQKLFIQFVFWIFLTSLYSLLLLVGLFLNCSTYSEAECIDDLGAFICIMLLFVEAILFGIFTLCMMGEQLSSASSNESHIDRLKAASSGDERVKEKLEVRIINEIFGCDMAVRFHWSWLIPVPTRFSPDMNDSLMGYRMSPASRDDVIRDDVIRDDVLVSSASGSPSGSGAIEDETVVGSGTPDVMSSIHEGPGIGGSHSISIRKRQPGPVVMASEDPSSSTSRLGEDRDE